MRTECTSKSTEEPRCMLIDESIAETLFVWDHFGTTRRLRYHKTRKRSEANSLPTCGFMVAGAGFEPTTFGL